MTEKRVWLVTGAGRGMGVDIAKAALAAGHAVVATGRNPDKVSAAVGAHDDLLVVELDVTDPASAAAAIQAHHAGPALTTGKDFRADRLQVVNAHALKHAINDVDVVHDRGGIGRDESLEG